MVFESISNALGWAGTIAGLFTSLYLFRRAKKAEVNSKEIAIADQMIELVKKANAEALELNRKENEKLRKSISKLEKALRVIGDCPHRNNCPVTEQLQSDAIFNDKTSES